MADDFDFLPLDSSERKESGQQQGPSAKAPPGHPNPLDKEPPGDEESLLPQALLELMPPVPKQQPKPKPQPKQQPAPKASAAKPPTAPPPPPLPPAAPQRALGAKPPECPRPEPKVPEPTEKVLEDLFPEQFAQPPAPAPENKPAPEAPEKVLKDLFPDEFAAKPEEPPKRAESQSVEAVLNDLFDAQPAAPAAGPKPAAKKVDPDADTKRLMASELSAARPAGREEPPAPVAEPEPLPAPAAAATPGPEPVAEAEPEPGAAPAPEASGPVPPEELPAPSASQPEAGIKLEPDTRALSELVPVALESFAPVERQREPEPEPEPAPEPESEIRIESDTRSLEVVEAPAAKPPVAEVDEREGGAAPVEVPAPPPPAESTVAPPAEPATQDSPAASFEQIVPQPSPSEPEPKSVSEPEPEPEAQPATSKGMFGRFFGKIASAFSLKPREEAPEPQLEPVTQEVPVPPAKPPASKRLAPAAPAEPSGLEIETRTFLEPVTGPPPASEPSQVSELPLEPVTRSLDTPVMGIPASVEAPSTGLVSLPDEAEIAPPEQPASRADSDAVRLREWCRALEARIKALSREKDSLLAENERLAGRVKELVAVIKGVEQAFVVGRMRRGQPLPAQPPPAATGGWSGPMERSDKDTTRLDKKPL